MFFRILSCLYSVETKHNKCYNCIDIDQTKPGVYLEIGLDIQTSFRYHLLNQRKKT